jgi:hypothetical protein
MKLEGGVVKGTELRCEGGLKRKMSEVEISQALLFLINKIKQR